MTVGKTFCKILLLLVLTAPACMADTRPFFAVGDDDFPPFSYSENGIKRGIDCDVIRMVFQRLQMELRLELVPWQRLIAMTREGKCDGAFSLFKTAEREQFALFATKRPIHESTFHLFVHHNAPRVRYNSISDLHGKTIGLNRGFAISDAFDQAAARGLIRIEEVEGFQPNLKKLLAGRIDAFAANYHVAMYELNSMNPRPDVTYIPMPLTKNRGAYFVISRKSKIEDKEGLLEKIQVALESIYSDGGYDEIVERNLEGKIRAP